MGKTDVLLAKQNKILETIAKQQKQSNKLIQDLIKQVDMVISISDDTFSRVRNIDNK